VPGLHTGLTAPSTSAAERRSLAPKRHPAEHRDCLWRHPIRRRRARHTESAGRPHVCDRLTPTPLGRCSQRPTRIATKLCRTPWNVTPYRPDRVTAGCHSRRENRPRASGPPRGAVNTRASGSGPTKTARCSSSRRITARATGTVRLERDVFGSWPRVTCPRTSTAVEPTVTRHRNTSTLARVRPAGLWASNRLASQSGRDVTSGAFVSKQLDYPD